MAVEAMHPTPWQHFSLSGQRPVCVVHVPSAQTGRVQSVEVPPSSGSARGMTVVAQSLSWQQSAQVPVAAQQSVPLLHCLFEQQSAHLPVFAQHVCPWLHERLEYSHLPLLQATF